MEKNNKDLVKKSTLFAAVGTMAALSFSGTAQAADQALLDILLSNNAITQVQYDELLAKEALTAEDAAYIVVECPVTPIPKLNHCYSPWMMQKPDFAWRLL